eukprot:TRINITY_DN66046_c2_g3_i2.p1 TRINITY_DN66046_c2_g3~~TRINITY_DN66046_c2_g3_i2.p1  ORF type:complete len:1093 (-),score=97.98 TRINITY_DN66046_c2_g3_i2:1250-4528(-)
MLAALRKKNSSPPPSVEKKRSKSGNRPSSKSKKREGSKQGARPASRSTTPKKDAKTPPRSSTTPDKPLSYDEVLYQLYRTTDANNPNGDPKRLLGNEIRSHLEDGKIVEHWAAALQHWGTIADDSFRRALRKESNLSIVIVALGSYNYNLKVVRPLCSLLIRLFGENEGRASSPLSHHSLGFRQESTGSDLSMPNRRVYELPEVIETHLCDVLEPILSRGDPTVTTLWYMLKAGQVLPPHEDAEADTLMSELSTAWQDGGAARVAPPLASGEWEHTLVHSTEGWTPRADGKPEPWNPYPDPATNDTAGIMHITHMEQNMWQRPVETKPGEAAVLGSVRLDSRESEERPPINHYAHLGAELRRTLEVATQVSNPRAASVHTPPRASTAASSNPSSRPLSRAAQMTSPSAVDLKLYGYTNATGGYEKLPPGLLAEQQQEKRDSTTKPSPPGRHLRDILEAQESVFWNKEHQREHNTKQKGVQHHLQRQSDHKTAQQLTQKLETVTAERNAEQVRAEALADTVRALRQELLSLHEQKAASKELKHQNAKLSVTLEVQRTMTQAAKEETHEIEEENDKLHRELAQASQQLQQYQREHDLVQFQHQRLAALDPDGHILATVQQTREQLQGDMQMQQILHQQQQLQIQRAALKQRQLQQNLEMLQESVAKQVVTLQTMGVVQELQSIAKHALPAITKQKQITNQYASVDKKHLLRQKKLRSSSVPINTAVTKCSVGVGHHELGSTYKTSPRKSKRAQQPSNRRKEWTKLPPLAAKKRSHTAEAAPTQPPTDDYVPTDGPEPSTHKNLTPDNKTQEEDPQGTLTPVTPENSEVTEVKVADMVASSLLLFKASNTKPATDTKQDEAPDSRPISPSEVGLDVATTEFERTNTGIPLAFSTTTGNGKSGYITITNSDSTLDCLYAMGHATSAASIAVPPTKWYQRWHVRVDNTQAEVAQQCGKAPTCSSWVRVGIFHNHTVPGECRAGSPSMAQQQTESGQCACCRWKKAGFTEHNWNNVTTEPIWLTRSFPVSTGNVIAVHLSNDEKTGTHFEVCTANPTATKLTCSLHHEGSPFTVEHYTLVVQLSGVVVTTFYVPTEEC